jgi:putative salt-induced outer membrane protein YdiY
MNHQIYRLAATFILALLCVPSAFAKRTDDVVILKNGDRLTGEIKSLQRGELRFKADYMAEAVRLDWTKVERLESKDRYLISLTDGQLFTESFALNSLPEEGPNNFVIGVNASATRVDKMDVIRILPVESKFWQQLEGTVDLGFSFTSGNNQYQTQLSASTTYRSGDHTFAGRIDSSFSGQPQGSRTARNQFTFDYRKQISPNWFIGGLFDVLQSDQQSLDRRLTVGGLAGRQLLQTERTRFSLFAGVAGSRENYSELIEQPRTTNADAVVGFDFNTFRFKTTDIRSRFISYPSLTTPGRVRFQTTSDLYIKVVKDLYWGFHLYENFDSKPPVSANKNDLGVSTSIGWKF